MSDEKLSADNPRDASSEDFLAVVEQMRAVHAAGGTALSREETIDFITRPIWFGPPLRVTPKARGRRPRRTQYDDAVARRKGLYHRLVRLPGMSFVGGTAASDSTLKARKQIQTLALRLAPTVPPRKLATSIFRVAERERSSREPSTPSIETIRRVLRVMKRKGVFN